MGHHDRVNLPPLQHRAQLLAGLQQLQGDAFKRSERHRLVFRNVPIDLAPRHGVVNLQIAFRQHRQRRLKGAQSNLFANQSLRRIDPGIGVHPHLRHAEQSSRKHRNRRKRHAAALGDQVIRQRQLADVELALLQHPLVAILPVL